TTRPPRATAMRLRTPSSPTLLRESCETVWQLRLQLGAKFLQSQPYVDPDRVLLVGHSAGAFGSIASASLAPHGLAAVITLAGGRGSQESDTVCRKDVLIRAYGSFGKKVRAPSLWVYAENDHFFDSKLARAMFAAFTAGGAPGELIIAPPFGTDGH